MFFVAKEKKVAYNTSKLKLRMKYVKSERDLKKVALTGNEEKLENAMARHHTLEYAMLFQKTPEYKRNKR